MCAAEDVVYQSVEASELYFAVVCWGSSIKPTQPTHEDSWLCDWMQTGHFWSSGGEEDVGQTVIRHDDPDHRLHQTLDRQRSSFSNCLKNRYRRSVLLQTRTLYSTSPLSNREHSALGSREFHFNQTLCFAHVVFSPTRPLTDPVWSPSLWSVFVPEWVHIHAQHRSSCFWCLSFYFMHVSWAEWKRAGLTQMSWCKNQHIYMLPLLVIGLPADFSQCLCILRGCKNNHTL